MQRKPGVAEFRIRYVYPDYLGRPPLLVSNTDGLIEALDELDDDTVASLSARILEQEMREASAALDFERAARLRDQLLDVRAKLGSGSGSAATK